MIRYDIDPSVTAFTLTRGDNGVITPQGLLSHRPDIRVAACHQTHSANVRLISKEFFELSRQTQENVLDDVDALISDQEGICLTVRTADCTPILLYDTVHRAIAAVHSGWRGTLQNIVHATFREMSAAFNTKPEETKALIGPSIAQSNYQVSDELFSLFSSADSRYASFFQVDLNAPGHYFLDVRGIVRQQLLDLNVPDFLLTVTELDTFTDERLYSARREGATTGRLISAIHLND